MESLGKPKAPSERFPKSMRLHSRLDFNELFDRGAVAVEKSVVVHARRAQQPGRLGISVSKRVGSAPVRNRWKRLIRESYRRLVGQSPAVRQIDLVVRPRRGAQADFQAIQRSLENAVRRLLSQVLGPTPPTRRGP